MRLAAALMLSGLLCGCASAPHRPEFLATTGPVRPFSPAAMNEVYVTFFDAARRPARSAMGASGLALDARVEIECIAAV